jgi:hypothetical protein
MPKFVIERQYLVPMYQHIVVEAESLEEACKNGISNDIDWDTQEMDSDNARQTTITNVKVIPDALEPSPQSGNTSRAYAPSIPMTTRLRLLPPPQPRSSLNS